MCIKITLICLVLYLIFGWIGNNIRINEKLEPYRIKSTLENGIDLFVYLINILSFIGMIGFGIYTILTFKL